MPDTNAVEVEIAALVENMKGYVCHAWEDDPGTYVGAMALCLTGSVGDPAMMLVPLPGMSIADQRDVLVHLHKVARTRLVCVVNECVVGLASTPEGQERLRAAHEAGTLHMLSPEERDVDVVQIIVEGVDTPIRVLQAKIAVVAGKRILGEYEDITAHLEPPYFGWRRYFPSTRPLEA